MIKIRQILLFTIICLFLTCREYRPLLDIYGDNSRKPKPSHSVITIYTPDQLHSRQTGVTKELEKRLENEMNVSLEFVYNADHWGKIQEAMDEGKKIDAFLVSGNMNYLFRMLESGYCMDITTLFPEWAPRYYNFIPKELMDSLYYNEKLYSIPAFRITDTRRFALLRTDIRDKYSLKEIHNWEELEETAETIKRNEDEMNPLSLSSSLSGLFSGYYGYYQFNEVLDLVYSENDYKLIPWEETAAFEQAVDRYFSWYKKGYLKDQLYQTPKEKNLIVSERFPLWIGTLDDLVLFNQYCYEEEKNWTYTGYPLESEAENRIEPIIEAGIMISSSSEQPEKVLQLIEWIHSSQENYDLFHYGIEGTDYTLQNGYLAPGTEVNPEGAFFNRSRIAFQNVMFERMSIANPSLPPDIYSSLYQQTPRTAHSGFNMMLISFRFRNRTRSQFTLEKKIVEGNYTPDNLKQYRERAKESDLFAALDQIQSGFYQLLEMKGIRQP